MTLTHLKLLVAGMILATAVGYLAVAGVKSGWVYFVDVDSYVADPELQSQRVRLHGQVASDGFELSPARLMARFQLEGVEATITVLYRGNIPEMFGVGRSVVVEGKADEAGVFQANILMTKCASKYEPDSPHAEAQP